MRSAIALAVMLLAVSATATVFFEEQFSDDWNTRWVQSQHKSDLGTFVTSAGKYFNDAEEDKGIKTSTDARFYALSAKFDEFSNEGKDLYISFIVKHEQNIDCGGGYVKLFPAGLDQTDMHGETPYNVMFGPDICGPGTRKVHVILSYKGENKQVSKSIPCKFDQGSHLYTLILKKDNSYEVQIDGAKVESGSIEADFDMLPAKKINDPSVSKPADWVDTKQIPDPEDTKPEDWDRPSHVADPAAEKPEDWDEEMDGEWEAPMIPNPDYKGEWKPKMIDNPAYKGEWVHPQIDNPAYAPNDKLYAYDSFGAIGFDLWQVKSGTIFDSVLITDDAAKAEAAVAAFKTRKAGEDAAKSAAEEAEKKAAEEAKAAAEAAKGGDDDEDDDEDDDVKDEL